MNDYLGIIIGAIIGFLSAFLSTFLLDYFRARRELKKWKLESAHEFYRRLYDSLAPFFSTPYKFMFAMLMHKAYQIKNLSKEEQQQISSNLDGIITEIMDAYINLVNKGYIGLFPKDLGGMILGFTVRLTKVSDLIKEKGVVDEETLNALSETLSKAERIRNRMRQLLNVDALG